MHAPQVGQVPIFTASGEPSAAERSQSCKITADIAAVLGIPLEPRAGEKSTVLVGVTPGDANPLFNPEYADFLGRKASFLVDEILSGFQRVEIHPNSGPGARDGGVFRLFGTDGNPFAGVCIPVNARVTLWNESGAAAAPRLPRPAPGTEAGPLHL